MNGSLSSGPSLAEYAAADATELAQWVRDGDASAAELAALSRLALMTVDARLHSVVETFEAPELSSSFTTPGAAPFSGVPFLVKDLLLCVQGRSTKSGSRLSPPPPAAVDSELMRRFRRAGLVTLGVTATPEFGGDVTTEPEALEATRNPWGLDRSAGGSSGGAAAAVAARVVPLAHASDGLGSIRIPAAACGVFGLKPTRQRTPTGPFHGDLLGGRGVEFAITRSVRDAAALLDLVAGPDSGAPSWAPVCATGFSHAVRVPTRGLRIAVSQATFRGAAVTSDAFAAVQKIAQRCESLGHFVEVAVPVFDFHAYRHAVMTTWAAGACAGSRLWEQANRRSIDAQSVDRSTWLAIERGRTLKASDFVIAQGDLARTQRDIGRFFERFDVLITPMLSRPVAAIGELKAAYVDFDAFGDHVADDAYSPFVGVFNVTGHPAASIPASVGSDGIPVGVQLVGGFGREDHVLSLAAQLEEVLQWQRNKPPVCAGFAP